MIRFPRIRTVIGILLLIFFTLFRPNSKVAASTIASAPPPIPPVVSVNDLGVVVQNPVIYGRDGTFSALIDGKSVWTFGDTPLAIYSGVYSNDDFYRVSYTPWGPWSDQALLFTGETGWNNNSDYAAEAHNEFAEANGQIQYVTYVHATGFLRFDLPLMQVVFDKATH